jgi:hypothetical protein
VEKLHKQWQQSGLRTCAMRRASLQRAKGRGSGGSGLLIIQGGDMPAGNDLVCSSAPSLLLLLLLATAGCGKLSAL